MSAPAAKEWDPLKPEEQKIYDQLASFAKEHDYAEPHHDMLIRFVRGYHHEKPRLEKTLEVFKKALDWRKEWKADGALDQSVDLDRMDAFTDLWPHHVHGVDKQGHPISIDEMGIIDPQTMQKSFSIREMQEFHVRDMEAMCLHKRDLSKKNEQLTYKQLAIMDLEGFGMKHTSSSFRGPIQEVIHIDQYYYPETLYRLYIINSPWIFKTMWKIIRAFVHPITRERINVLGSSFLSKLKDDVDVTQLPKYYGGSCTIPGCRCESKESMREYTKEVNRAFSSQRKSET